MSSWIGFKRKTLKMAFMLLLLKDMHRFALGLKNLDLSIQRLGKRFFELVLEVDWFTTTKAFFFRSSAKVRQVMALSFRHCHITTLYPESSFPISRKLFHHSMNWIKFLFEDSEWIWSVAQVVIHHWLSW